MTGDGLKGIIDGEGNVTMTDHIFTGDEDPPVTLFAVGDLVYVDPAFTDEPDDPHAETTGHWQGRIVAVEVGDPGRPPDAALVQDQADPNRIVAVPCAGLTPVPVVPDPYERLMFYGRPFRELPARLQAMLRSYNDRGLTWAEWSPIDRDLAERMLRGENPLVLVGGRSAALAEWEAQRPSGPSWDEAQRKARLDGVPTVLIAWNAYLSARNLSCLTTDDYAVLVSLQTALEGAESDDPN